MNAKNGLLLFVTAVSCYGWSNGNNSNNKNPKLRDDECVGVIGFSSAEVSKVHSTGLLQYKTNIYDSSHGWNRDTGTFTVKCPGLYSVSFTAYGIGDSRFTLRKRTISNQFIPIISTPPGGGTNSIIVSLETAEQLSVTISGGLRAGLESTAPVNTFTVYRVAADK